MQNSGTRMSPVRYLQLLGPSVVTSVGCCRGRPCDGTIYNLLRCGGAAWSEAGRGRGGGDKQKACSPAGVCQIPETDQQELNLADYLHIKGFIPTRT